MTAPTRKIRPSQKSIFFDVMEEALSDAGYFDSDEPIVSQRDLFYSARELYFAHPDFPEVEAKLLKKYENKPCRKPGGPAAIGYDYFTQNILVKWEAANGKLDRLIRDVRGHLYEPHSGKIIEIGTVSVMEYRFPEFVFDKLLYIEKEGEMAKVRQARLAEKYDVAILTGKGFPTEAIRNLLSMASEGRDYQIFCFHDADHSGYEIVRTLREETELMPGYSVDVIDLGLTYEDAEEMGLDGEPYTRNRALPEALVPTLTDHAWETMEGERVGKNTWRSYRYELNTIKPPERRMAYVERKLEENGVRPKVIPPNERLRDDLTERRDSDIELQIGMAIDRVVDREAIVSDLTGRFEDAYEIEDPRRFVEEGFERDRYQSWRGVLGRHVRVAGWSIQDEIEAAVRERIENGGAG